MAKDNVVNLEIPKFLRRSGKGLTEEKAMSNTETKGTGAAKAKATGNAVAKPAKAPKAAAKAPDSPAKAKGGKLDAYGYREGSKKAQAAAIYAAKNGATLDEVKNAISSTQLNVLTELEGKGYKVKRVKEDGKGSRQVTRYFLGDK